MRVNLFNSQAPNGLRIPVNVNIQSNDLVSSNDGDVVYIIELSTGAVDTAGNTIDVVVINNVSQEDVKEEISKALAEIASQIDWGALKEDDIPPQVEYLNPEPEATNVPIHSNVSITLKDHFPFTGIDPNSIILYVNDINVTSETTIKQDANIAKLLWIPKRIIE
jgi:hypothetical protein